MIRLTIPSIEQDDLAAVAGVLQSGFLVQGARVREFEESVAASVGVDHAVAVSNCTAALHLALLGLGIAPGDAVAVTTYSWPATANVIVLSGARPVFVDVDPATFNIDPDKLAETLDREQVRALIAVNAFGGMADWTRIAAIAAQRGIPTIEDAACSLGAELGGRRSGAWANAGCFSFHPRKAITTGEGGIITTADAGLAKRMRALRNHGLDPDAPTVDFIDAGFNLRLTEFQAALGSTQMTKLERIVTARRRAAARYDQLLATHLPGSAPRALEPLAHVYQSYVVLLPAEAAPQRGVLITTMKERGIETTIGTYHMPLTSYFRRTIGHKPGDFPVTDDIAARALSLPLFETISVEQQETVVRTLVEVIAELAPAATLAAK